MKKINFLLPIIVLFAAFNFTACNDIEPIDPDIVIPTPDPDDPDPELPEDGLFKVDIDGTTYTATGTLVYISGGSIILNALRPEGDRFAFMLDGTSEGTYAANENIVTYTPAGSDYGYWSIDPDDAEATTGTVKITEIDEVNHTISGTFSYTGYWSNLDQNFAPKVFTNGVFTKLPYVVENPTEDTFFAKVNGTEFVDTDILVVETTVGATELLSVGAENAAGNSLTVSVKSELGTGIYTITGDTATDPAQIMYALTEDDFGTAAATGTVTITEKTDDRIKGTFSGTVTIETVEYQITEGNFDVAW